MSKFSLCPSSAPPYEVVVLCGATNIYGSGPRHTLSSESQREIKMEKELLFLKLAVHLITIVAGSSFVMLPCASGDLVQMMPGFVSITNDGITMETLRWLL
jgi:hypothetical protein